jgi:hypothetical protein
MQTMLSSPKIYVGSASRCPLTIPVEEGLKETSYRLNRPKSSKRSRRQIYFDERSNIAHENSNSAMEDIRCLWYTEQDYVNFRNDALLAIELNPDCDIYLKVLDELHSACGGLRPEHHLRILLQKDGSVIRRLFGANVTRLGLEKYASQRMKQDKLLRRRHMLQIVAVIEDRTTLRKVLETTSRPNRLFAQLLAQIQLLI